MKEIGCHEPGFLNRTDDIAKPFLRIKVIEDFKGMNWFHCSSSNPPNPDIDYIRVIGNG